MIFFQKDICSIPVYFFSVLGLLFYLYGFFPLNSSPKWTDSGYDPLLNYSIARHIDKLAFIVIDSLRYDFVMSSNVQNYMPFTRSSILHNQSCLVRAIADSPTVTMPRIKALTSGTLSTYADVIFNLMTPHFEEDNFIMKAALKGLKIVFYGDDTWLKLFPKAFLRSEGTNSFFALDFTEVDSNVTRHIDGEFKKDDWDIIILHYLGLDHIGHLEGPSSSLVKPKLIEMDEIIKKVSDHFKMLEKRDGLKTLVIVTGDHGMKDSGGHGGVTYPEINVPLISVGQPCRTLPGWPINDSVFQIDIAPTVSAVLGLPPPAKSIGKIIPSLLHSMESSEVLKYLEINRQQLNKFRGLANTDLNLNSIAKSLNKWVTNKSSKENLQSMIIAKYFQYLDCLSQEITNSRANVQIYYLLLGLVFLWVSLITLLYQLSHHFHAPQRMSQLFLIFGTFMHGLSLASSSFIEEEHQTWYFFWITFCILAIFECLNLEKISFLQKLKISLPWIFLCFIHRVLRKLNQTGDKWAFLPDIKSYLNSAEGQHWLLALFLAGMVLLFWFALCEGCMNYQLGFYGLALICIIYYRIKSGNIKIKFMEFQTTSKGTIEILMFWTFLSIFSIQTFLNKMPVYLIWLLLGSLLLRPHNILLLAIQVFASKQINKLFQKTDLVWKNMAHVWLGNLFYFYQGNSNSLANIDVASGFIGIQSYNPIYAGIMVTAHTFNGQILSFILSPKLNALMAILRIIPLTLYCTFLIFQLNHLFIWSVFSPKLLYEASITVVFLMLIFLSISLHK